MGDGDSKEYQDAAKLGDLVDRGVISRIQLPVSAEEDFLDLTLEGVQPTLGDGEAAVIICAEALGCWVAIDERKVRRICRERYPNLMVVSGVDILSHESVTTALSEVEMKRAALAALTLRKMQVHDNHIDWILSLLDPADVHKCPSLPKRIRNLYPKS